MKSKELIKELERLDPTGECEVTMGGEAILFANKIPGYYDGPYDVHIKDKNGYAVGIKVTAEGYEIRLMKYNIEDMLMDDVNAKYVINKSVHQSTAFNYIERFEKLRRETIELNEEIEKERLAKLLSGTSK